MRVSFLSRVRSPEGDLLLLQNCQTAAVPDLWFGLVWSGLVWFGLVVFFLVVFNVLHFLGAAARC